VGAVGTQVESALKARQHEHTMIPTPTERREGGTAWLLRFRPEETVEAGAKRILATLTEDMLRFLDEPAGLGPDTTIHEVRRRGKQARAMLRLVRPVIEDDFKKIDRLYRDAGRLLAAARDARIVVDTLDDLPSNDGSDSEIRTLLEDLATVEATRVFNGADNPAMKAQAMLDRARSTIVSLEIPDEAASIADGATQTYAAGQKSYRRASRKETPEAFHTWRKRVKQRRHHISYLWDCAPIDPATHERLYELSDLLGTAHDLVVFHQHVAVATDSMEVIEAAARRRRTLEMRALKLGSAVFAPDPTDVHDSLVSTWNRWSEPDR
jgi:hypothetical protein